MTRKIQLDSSGQPMAQLEILRGHMAREDWQAAIKLAASFPQLGAEKVPISRAWEAIARPDFCRQLKRDPAVLIEEGKAALRRRYGGAT